VIRAGIFFNFLYSSLNVFAALTIQSKTYNAGIETINYSDGTHQAFNSTSAPVSWATDHITMTITYTFADSTHNPVVSTVQPTKSTPTFNVGVETYTLTYGDGYKPTVTAKF